MALDDSRWRHWLGRTEVADDRFSGARIDAFSATLNDSGPPAREGDPIPPGWHRLFFHKVVPTSELRGDGHLEEFLPPIPLARRMWANTRMIFYRPLRVGESVRRVSTIAAIDPKEGRTGPLVFVTTRMEFFGGEGLAAVEEQTSVFRGGREAESRPPNLQAEPAAPVWQRSIDPSPVFLFRYSALTMNSHRIHYDRRYAIEVEGYPGLLVHGSLQTLLLLDLVRQDCPRRSVANCLMRAHSPIFDTAAFHVRGAPAADDKSAALWTLSGEGRLGVSATVNFVN